MQIDEIDTPLPDGIRFCWILPPVILEHTHTHIYRKIIPFESTLCQCNPSDGEHTEN